MGSVPVANEALQRLAAAAHFVIANAGDDLGKTKLNKILWFADCAAWRRTGRTITGLTHYAKLQYGPVPPKLDAALMLLAADGAVESDKHYVGTYVRHGFFSKKSPATGNILGPDEQAILSEIIDAVRNMTAFEVSELSHDALWHETAHGGKISVEAASVKMFETPDPRILDWARSRRA
ncbi:MAG: hypothetical protein B7Y90_01660 [Alphaproteobacteria bacterium 32-64-14]|nr:MAG: hypothetical protein B7Y90_01660 [Alphaproteobacteria bacterium 32-64-14]